MSRVVDARYICQSAANAIISEIGPYRVSNDALQTINQFLDEFLTYLLSSSLSLDLSRIKAVVFTLLPSTLGKNAIVEAELEVKTFTETEAIDYDTYERMRLLGSHGAFPLNDALPLLREKCLEFCTLADREEPRNSIGQSPTNDISIAPIVAIYVTTVLEHIAEYVLTAIAMTAEHEDVEYIRIKEVFLALIDDVQVGGVFYRMELREKLEKRAFAHGYRPRTSTYAPSIQQKHVRSSTAGSIQPNAGGDGFLDITFDDLDLGYEDDDRPTRQDHLSMSAYSMKSNVSQQRPTSMMSSSTSAGTISTLDSSSNSKKAYKVFKKDGMEKPVSVSVYDPEAPTMNFEDLIRSGNTMRVSLTPNRLRSIEVKDQTVEEPSINWERRSTASLSRSRGSAPPSRSASPVPRGRMPPPPRPASTTPPLQEFEPRQKSNLGPRIENRPRSQSPVRFQQKSAAVKPSPIHPRFENPRDAPEPPKPKPIPHKPVHVVEKAPSPVEKALDKLSSVEKTASLVEKVPSPVEKMPSPVEKAPSPVEKAPSTVEKTASTLEKTASPVTKTASPIAKAQPVKKEEVRVMRRSSMSSRKSRENLRRQREKDALAAATSSELPKQPNSPVVSAKRSQESVGEDESSVLPSPPASENASATSKDSIKEMETDDEEKKAVHFDKEEEEEERMDSRDEVSGEKEEPERPSTIVAKRASMAGSSRRQSLHESYAVSEKMERKMTAGSVETTVKGWETLMKHGEEKITPAVPRRRMKQRSEEEATGALTRDPPLATHHPRPVSSVLDKVMKFEQANSLDDFAQQHHRQHRASAYIPRRERFLYLQREPGLLERRTPASFKPRPIAVDAEVQTDPVRETNAPPALVITTEDDMGVTTRKEVDMESGSEHGMVDGDEEWFLQDDEWDDTQDQETAVVEWLLGEA
ncbi:hypothetical protein BJV82DRAFT_673252 [Fennellomyces sp. T-0311]|nr:hypothetical protein BJV82DRAFT_673252 [Fennellomyces sp. T-0311]